MHNYQLDIKLIEGKNIIGKAKTTRIANKKEFLVFEIKGETKQIRLDRIQSITALDNKAVFKMVEIN